MDPDQNPTFDERWHPLVVPAGARRRPARASVLALRVHLGLLALILVLVVGPPLYSMIHAAPGYVSDYPAHVDLIQAALKDGSWQPHFLFQRLVWLVSGFSAETGPLRWAMFAVVLASVFAKAALTHAFYARSFARRPAPLAFRLGVSTSTLAFALSLASLVLLPIARAGELEKIYLGQIAPNVWHNPTSLVAWPMMLALFFVGDRYLRSADRPTLALFSVLLVLNVVTKPNSVMVFLPAFALVGLVRLRPLRTLAWTAAAIVPAVAALAVQWWWTYRHGAQTGSMTIVFAPLEAWHLHSSSIVMSIVRSMAFPAAYVALHPRPALRSPLLGLAWGTFLVSLLWVAFAAESGVRMWHFNFSWGAHLASYILFIVTIAEWLQGETEDTPPSAARRRWRDVALVVVLAAHLVSGIVYFLRVAVGLGFT